ncbi:MAG TPA: hypothetical protein VK152_10305 [Paludibacter sp.]|nr:hypothetical protein [Paludibacter sp.]
MKTTSFYAVIAAFVFTTASCVENSQKYKDLVAQRDSLALEKQAVDSNYNQTLNLLNDIESGFAQINQNQKEMQVDIKGVEGNRTNKREAIAAQMTAIKESMEKNQARIDELQRLAKKTGKANSQLNQTIKRLQAEMEEKNAQIQSLQAELEQKNIKINELTTTVDVQTRSIAEQQSVMEQQTSTIKSQDADINTVWYCIAPSKKLKDQKIISGGGLFSSKKVMDKEFDNSAFTQVDMRNISSIPTNSKKVKILSQHPQNSYKLVSGSDKNITIEIVNPKKFWSVSRYLVVEI